MHFFRRNKARIIWLLVVIALLVLISSTSKGRKSMSKLESIFGRVLSPVNKLVTKVSSGVNRRFSSLRNLFKTYEENKELKKKIASLEKENRDYEKIIGQSPLIKREYEFLKSTSYNLIEARVTAKEPDNWFDRFTIDKGTKDGVKKNSIVVQAVETEYGEVIEGLVGRVVEADTSWAKVVSIVDEANSMDFKSIRTQDGGVVAGNIDSEMTGFLYDEEAELIKGDKIMTTGLGGIYREGLYIGTITEVKDDKESMMKVIKVEPAIDFKNLYKVYILAE